MAVSGEREDTGWGESGHRDERGHMFPLISEGFKTVPSKATGRPM